MESLTTLADANPEDRPAARAETPAPEAAAWLANPATVDRPSSNMQAIEMLERDPDWTGVLRRGVGR